MVDWSGLAALKYSILGQQADAAAQQANTGTLAQRAQAPVQAAAAQQALADAELRRQQGFLTGQNFLESQNFNKIFSTPRSVAGGLNLGLPGDTPTTTGSAVGVGGLPGGVDMVARASAAEEARKKGMVVDRYGTRILGVGGLKKGIARVPGKGTEDTVPAMLAPGEAVLNAPAASGMGRGLIEMLNQMGQQKMGMI